MNNSVALQNSRLPILEPKQYSQSLIAVLLVLTSIVGVSWTSRAAAVGALGSAIEVPGLASLNIGGVVSSVVISCSAPGSCSAGGTSLARNNNTGAFVVDEVDGTWGSAEEVPGTASLNESEDVTLISISCGSPGNCSAGGYYGGDMYGNDGTGQAFLVDEVDGTWGTAFAVSGTGIFGSQINEMSCSGGGNCAAGGAYLDDNGNAQAFVVDEVDGTWGSAIEVPGSDAMNAGGDAAVSSISCTSPGNCSAGGYYAAAEADSEDARSQAFVVDEVDGTWGSAIEVPGTSNLNDAPLGIGDGAEVDSISCSSSGNCSGVGDYYNKTGHPSAFAVTESGGIWGTAIQLHGTAGSDLDPDQISCHSPGNCGAGGALTITAGNEANQEAFVVNETGGKWGSAVIVPGVAAMNHYGPASEQAAETYSISCPSAGGCSAGGYYYTRSGEQEAFIVSEVRGHWGSSIEVPGTSTLNAGGGPGPLYGTSVDSISCDSTTQCGAIGLYPDRSHNIQAFVVTVAPNLSEHTILCVKGKTVRKVTAVSPRCPAGYKTET